MKKEIEMLKLVPLFLLVATNLSAVDVFFEKTDTGLRIEHHRIPGKNAAVVHHKPQDPNKFPGRGGGKKEPYRGRGRGRDK